MNLLSGNRYIGGLSISTEGFVPSDEDQAKAIRTLIDGVHNNNEDKVTLYKTLSTIGHYGESEERSFDIDVYGKEGFNPTSLWHSILTIAKENNQDSCFLSRTLLDSEIVNPVIHRPGFETYFNKTLNSETIIPVIELLSENGIYDYTLIVSRQFTNYYFNGKLPPIVGIRFQYIPEIVARYGINEDKTGWTYISTRTLKQADYIRDLTKIADKLEFVNHSHLYWYETRAAFARQYDEELKHDWKGQDILSGIAKAI
jgi:hypothetical protein